MAETPDDLVDAEAICTSLDIEEGTIRSWASRGKIKRYPQGHRQRTLYSLSEVMRVYSGSACRTGLGRQVVQH